MSRTTVGQRKNRRIRMLTFRHGDLSVRVHGGIIRFVKL
jgi:hypothetical protein